MTYEEWVEAHDHLDRLLELRLPSVLVEGLRRWLPMSMAAPPPEGKHFARHE